MISMLVTGAAGFIGSHFTRYWLAEHPNDVIVALDALTYAGTETNLADIRQRITFVHGDIGDSALVQRVLSELEIDVVVNFAAESHTGVEASVEQVADLVLDELGLPQAMKVTVPDRPGHDRRYLLDSTKIRQELGWRPHIDFDAGVRETIRWYVDNRAWWEPLRDRSPVTEDTWATTT
jgi:dTDP-D-glucose 4,6-dehydratase